MAKRLVIAKDRDGKEEAVLIEKANRSVTVYHGNVYMTRKAHDTEDGRTVIRLEGEWRIVNEYRS